MRKSNGTIASAGADGKLIILIKIHAYSLIKASLYILGSSVNYLPLL